MVVSFVQKINETLISIFLNSFFSFNKGTKYTERDIYYIKKENRRLVKELICPKKKQKSKSVRDNINKPKSNNPGDMQFKNNNNHSDDSDDDKPSYNPRRQKFGNLSDYNTVQGCSTGT